jgi:hypothetical protein
MSDAGSDSVMESPVLDHATWIQSVGHPFSPRLLAG